MTPSLGKKFISELVGTWMLVFFGAGAAAVTLVMAEGEPRATEFNIGIGALGGLGDWLAIGLAFAFVIMAAIYVFGPISGCHINPAVTIALWASKRFPGKEVVPYLVAQFIGAFLGAVTIYGVLGPRGAMVGGLGAPAPFPGVSAGSAFLAEGIGTFMLILAIAGIALSKNAPPGWAGLVIGLYVAGCVTTTGNIAGSGINPARTFGPYLANTLFGGPNLWGHFWIFLIAPIVGAVIAIFLFDYLTATVQERSARQASAGS
ncbi:MAG TPA: aquaporin [Firmicutes bacterium]|nr:aquaporin [Bacillota bacterium]